MNTHLWNSRFKIGRSPAAAREVDRGYQDSPAVAARYGSGPVPSRAITKVDLVTSRPQTASAELLLDGQ